MMNNPERIFFEPAQFEIGRERPGKRSLFLPRDVFAPREDTKLAEISTRIFFSINHSCPNVLAALDETCSRVCSKR